MEAKKSSLFLLSPWMEQHNELDAGFSSRLGGVSEEQWQSLNLGLHVRDRDDSVITNRKRLTEALRWPFEAWTCAEQVHGSEVFQVTAAERGKGRSALVDGIAGCDALMTNVSGVLLTSLYADCVPLYFYAPDVKAVALAHAGWRGTVGEIADRTIAAMGEAYGAKPEVMQAAIGPSIGPCCYEVDGAVIREVERLLNELQLPGDKQETCMKLEAGGKARLNLKEINRQIMIKAGILPIHIELSKWCTGCRTDLFFSHRMEAGLTGRMASWIGFS
ncbi:peptidoglycan editing factor PgeF [Paenibacillus sp. HB172176]|uniref:peptidoglycan editing factor PgeF n=1 Tax=Paenibacillus sp. HB172176 TaxID=2493690 RepID=UPI00143B4C18|nr:peptidoglycan editing factor PgeF [Paenibacillus sp. HB172176]